MDITWYGHACFRLSERGVAIVTDPFSDELRYARPRIRADVVTLSAVIGDGRTLDLVKEWADDEFRSLNGQVEFLLRDALKRAGRLAAPGDDGPAPMPSECGLHCLTPPWPSPCRSPWWAMPRPRSPP